MKKTKVFLLIISIAFIFLLQKTEVFVLRSFPEDDIIFIKRINYGDSFVFSYIHSVSKTPIEEYLYIDNNNMICLNEVHYIDQGGAGMPEFAYDRETFETNNGTFIIKNFDRKFKNIIINVQQEYKNTLIFKDEELPLYKIFTGSNQIIIEAEKMNFLFIMFNKLKGR